VKAKEATARIKINRLLEEAGWRFCDNPNGPANIVLEPNTKITESQIDALGEDFQTTKNGFIDFLLLDKDGRPLIVLEAKSEGKNPLSAKEQARRYARAQNARFVILSNGNIHYLWDLKQGNPSVITKFPSPDAIKDHHAFQPDAERLASEVVERDYIALTQMPGYANEAGWKNEAEQPAFVEKNKLRFLRDYQKKAVHAVQRDAKKGAVRFLFEMANHAAKLAQARGTERVTSPAPPLGALRGVPAEVGVEETACGFRPGRMLPPAEPSTRSDGSVN
jgi:type I restriction enzyme, R subunit